MRRAYVVVGENEKSGVVLSWYAVAHSMQRADELCYEAEQEADPEDGIVYTWYEVIEEDD